LLTVLQRVAVRCSVLQCVAVCCEMTGCTHKSSSHHKIAYTSIFLIKLHTQQYSSSNFVSCTNEQCYIWLEWKLDVYAIVWWKRTHTHTHTPLYMICIVYKWVMSKQEAINVKTTGESCQNHEWVMGRLSEIQRLEFQRAHQEGQNIVCAIPRRVIRNDVHDWNIHEWRITYVQSRNFFFQCVAVCCSVLQYVAVCCSVL